MEFDLMIFKDDDDIWRVTGESGYLPFSANTYEELVDKLPEHLKDGL